MKFISILSIIVVAGALSACGGGGGSSSSSDSGNGAGIKSDVFLTLVSTVIGTSDDVSLSNNIDDGLPTSPEADDAMILT